MSDFICVLSDENGPITGAVVTELSWIVDQGWDWSAQFNSGFDPDWPEDKLFTITLTDGDGNPPLVTPPLVILIDNETDARSVDSAGLVTVTGVDLASQKMRVNDQSFTTFLASDVATIILALADRAGVTISGYPSWWVGEEDVKEQKLSDALRQYLDLAAYDLVAALDGTLVCSPWEAEADPLTMPFSNCTRSRNRWMEWTGLRVGKFSSAPDASNQFYQVTSAGTVQQGLDVPVYAPNCEGAPDHPGLSAVSFRDADGKMVNFLSWKGLENNQPLYLQNLATTIEIVTDPIDGNVIEYPTPCRIRAWGIPEGSLPPGIDAEFLHPPVPTSGPDTALGPRPAPESVIDSAWPSEAYALSRRPHILAKKNSDKGTLAYNRQIVDTSPRPHQRLTYRGHIYKVWEIRWSLSGNSTDLTLRRTFTDG